MFALILSFFLFKAVAGSMAINRMNMLSYLFYVPLVLMSFVGAVFIALKLDNHYLINKIHFDETRYVGWLAVLYAMIMLPIGMLLAKKIFVRGNLAQKIQAFGEKEITYSLGSKELVLKSILIGLSLFGGIILSYTFMHIGSIPLIALLKGNSAELARLRIMAAREFTGNVYLRNIFALQLLPLLAFVSFAYLQKEKSWINLAWVCFAFFVAVMARTYDLSAIFYWLCFLLCLG